MDYHVCKKNWITSIAEELQGFMEPANKLEKYAVPVKGKDGDVISHLPLGKSGKFANLLYPVPNLRAFSLRIGPLIGTFSFRKIRNRLCTA